MQSPVLTPGPYKHIDEKTQRKNDAYFLGLPHGVVQTKKKYIYGIRE